MVKLSFIIPCYNAEKYISRCLDSIYNQDIPESEFEVICVNDCSPDNMREIILEYQTQHNNLILIEHTENKRQGGARNTGLKNAKGEYIWFVDSDDSIMENSLCEIFEIIEKNNLDLLLFNVNDKTRVFLQETPITGIEYMENWMKAGKNSETMYCIWARLMKREIFVNNKVFFNEKMTLVEDVSYSYKMLRYAKKVMAVSESFYVFREENNLSVTRSGMTANKLFSAVILNPNEILNVADEYLPVSPFVYKKLTADATWWQKRCKSLFKK